MKIIDFSNPDVPADLIADHLNKIWIGVHGSIPRKEYYCGIACDIKKRFSDHKREDWNILDVVALLIVDPRRKMLM